MRLNLSRPLQRPYHRDAKNVYSEINLHITWHTKLSNPVLVETIENRVHHYLEHRARETNGVRFHALLTEPKTMFTCGISAPNLLISDWIEN